MFWHFACLFPSHATCKSFLFISAWSKSNEIMYVEAFCKLGDLVINKHVLLSLLCWWWWLLFSCIDYFALSHQTSHFWDVTDDCWLSQGRSYFLLELKKIWLAEEILSSAKCWVDQSCYTSYLTLSGRGSDREVYEGKRVNIFILCANCISFGYLYHIWLTFQQLIFVFINSIIFKTRGCSS